MLAQEGLPPHDASVEGQRLMLPGHVAARQFTDSSAVIWEVFEVRRASERAASVSPGLEAGWLTFVAGLHKRRLASYPESWWSLTDPELERLCLDARPSTPLVRAAPAEAPAPRIASRRAAVAPAPPAAPARSVAEPVPSSIDEEISSLARECRAAGLAAVAAMLRLKRLLVERDIASGTAEHKAARRLFVETFYFDRDG